MNNIISDWVIISFFTIENSGSSWKWEDEHYDKKIMISGDFIRKNVLDETKSYVENIKIIKTEKRRK